MADLTARVQRALDDFIPHTWRGAAPADLRLRVEETVSQQALEHRILRAALREIVRITEQTVDRPWTTITQANTLARAALAGRAAPRFCEPAEDPAGGAAAGPVGSPPPAPAPPVARPRPAALPKNDRVVGLRPHPHCRRCLGTGTYMMEGDAHRSSGIAPCDCPLSMRDSL